jgi:hypothetical protein
MWKVKISVIYVEFLIEIIKGGVVKVLADVCCRCAS